MDFNWKVYIMNKVVVIDSGVITHRSIFAWGNVKKAQLVGKVKDSFILPATYHYMNTCMSVLKKIGITKDDLVIIARDARMSWRKAFMPEYKAQRKAHRETYKHINWKSQFQKINELEQKLHESTNWHFLLLGKAFNYSDLIWTKEGQEFELDKNKSFDYDQEFGIEADDIQAVCAIKFPDKEVILVTIDEDLDQLCYFQNVKIFNPNLKFKSQKGCYKTGIEPIKLLEKKIRLGDKSDNIIVDKKNDNEFEVNRRKLVIDLLKLPDFVESKVNNVLHTLTKKDVNYSKLPFPNSLGKKFDEIYGQSKVISFEDAIKSNERKEKLKKKKQKEAYERRKAKMKKEKAESFR